MRLGLGVAVAALAAVFSTGAIGFSKGGVITTIAGTGKFGFSGDGGPAKSARLANPTGVAVDGQGNVYIADEGNSRVRKVGSDGKITTIAGTGKAGFSGDGGPATSARLQIVQAVAVDGQGNVYLADYGNHRIRKVSVDGLITTIAGTGKPGFSGDGGPAVSAKLDYPEGVGVDGAGNVYIADTANSRVRKVSTAGKITTFAGTGKPAFSGDGGRATSAALSRPTGVAVAGNGNVYIADFLNYRVRKVSPGGTITTIAGTGGSGSSGDGGRATSAELIPTSVAVDRGGNVYVGDFHKDRVRMVTPRGRITTFAGIGIRGSFGDDGPADTAQLYNPSAVAVDGKGNVYIADTQNNRVRKVWKGVAPVAPVTGSCSKSTARTLVERLRLGEAGFTTEPVAMVLCGAFTGPGSRAMVATLSGPTGLVGWAVFRFENGGWRLVMSRPNGVLAITGAGSDIRETLGVLAPGDSRCCPSSTRSRIWRWNGKRFVAGAWKAGGAPAAAAPAPRAKTGYLKTPSGNIVCGYGNGGKDPAYVGCRIKSGLKSPPTRRAPRCSDSFGVSLRATGRTTTERSTCPGEPEGDAGVLAYESIARVLGYGKTWRGGGIRCTSAVAGLTCRNKEGHGFFLSRESWRRF